MKGILTWIKSNLVVVIAGVVVMIALVGLFLGHVRGGGIEKRGSEINKNLRKITGLMGKSVEIPAANPGEKPTSQTVTVNPRVIEQLQGLLGRMKGEYNAIFGLAVERNQFGVSDHLQHAGEPQGHFPMMSGLFPTPSNPATPYDAKRAYREAFKQMLGSYSPESPYPNLNSGMPPNGQAIQAEVDRTQNDFKGRFVLNSSSLDDRQQAALRSEQQNAVLELLTQRARSIHIYAEQPLENLAYIQFPAGPFDIDFWSGYDGAEDKAPKVDEIWEGQMGLWMQQDIVEVIARMNEVWNPEQNVTTAPIKRLIGIEVVDGYIGVHTKGTLAGTRSSMSMSAALMRGGATLMGGRASRTPTAVGNPTTDFAISHTGRNSNQIYDVRHVQVTLVMDSQQLPRLFETLSEVNFMTVLKMTITDVDEYEALREGFVYGENDAVEVEILIETIWLRQWVTQWMPNLLKSELGILKEGDEGYVNPSGMDEDDEFGMGARPR